MRTVIPHFRALVLISATLPGAAVLADPYAPCYFPSDKPSGDLAPGYFPCHAFGKEVSSCCAPGWTCFSNSLCMATTPSKSWPNITIGAVQRGACTAPKWDNNACGSICLTGDNADGKLAYCGNNRYCCMGDFLAGKCTCAEGGGSFEQDGEAIGQTIIQVTDTSFTGRPNPTIATPPTIRSTGSEPSTTDASTTLSTSTTSRTSIPTESTASSTPTTDRGSGGSDDGGGGPKKWVIGVAVAVPVAAVIAAIVIGVYIYKRRHSQVTGPLEAETHGLGQPDDGPPYSYDTGIAENHQNGVSFGQDYYAQGAQR